MKTDLEYVHEVITEPTNTLVVLENGEVVITAANHRYGTVLVSKRNPVGYQYNMHSEMMPEIKSVIEKEVKITFKLK